MTSGYQARKINSKNKSKKMNRYTIRDLEKDVAKYNQQLAEAGERYRLAIEQSCGHTSLGVCAAQGFGDFFKRLESGTPRECWNARFSAKRAADSMFPRT